MVSPQSFQFEEMEKLYFIFAIILGSVLYNVAEVTTQPEWDNQQFINSMQRWFDSYQQQLASANETGGIGDQANSNPINQLVSDVAQGFIPSRDNKTNSYDLREAMVYLNASFGFPAVPDYNRTHNGSDDQVETFSAMFNAAASALLKPDSIPNYLNLLKNASSNLSVASDDTNDTINLTSESLNNQFVEEYKVALRRFEEALNSNKTNGNDTKGVSQNHINDVVSNINNQLTEMLKWPDNGNYSLYGNNQVINIFKN